MLSRHFFLVSLFSILLWGCQPANAPPSKLSIGVVSLEASDRSIDDYTKLKDYLSGQLNSIVELEPTYNERQALSQIQRQSWDLVFAPSGLAAIAVAQSQYLPIFSLEGGMKTRSVIVVLKSSSLNQLSDLNGKIIALGQPGSATGYYFPLYNLFGLTLAEVRLATTPKTVLSWVAQEEVDAGAMSLAQFNQHRADFLNQQFRILYTDSHDVPSGAVLVAPTMKANQQEQIRQALTEASPGLAASAGYVTNVPVPDYQYLIEVVERVNPLADKINRKPAPLY